MDGAADAGARTLFFELAPFSGRITVDPAGVNFHNSLPRTPEPYLDWAASRPDHRDWRALRPAIAAPKANSSCENSNSTVPLDSPFLFVPLQTPGDSQLRLFGGNFRTVEIAIEAVSKAARRLPEGWHIRIKEHPTSPIRFDGFFRDHAHDKIVLDNLTDTFRQVSASKGVITVNSSVGLQAMLFDKPVVALGDCFWAIPGIAQHCPNSELLEILLSDPEALDFDVNARQAFLSFLAAEYYPMLCPGKDHTPDPENTRKIAARLSGLDEHGIWARANSD